MRPWRARGAAGIRSNACTARLQAPGRAPVTARKRRRARGSAPACPRARGTGSRSSRSALRATASPRAPARNRSAARTGPTAWRRRARYAAEMARGSPTASGARVAVRLRRASAYARSEKRGWRRGATRQRRVESPASAQSPPTPRPPVLENLTERLSRIAKAIRGEARLTEANIQEALREVRMALLEADVALPVVKTFIERVREAALGAEVVGSLTPGQALVGVVHRELTALMGGEDATLDLTVAPPAVVLLAGMQGSGKTTPAASRAIMPVTRG